MDANDIGQAKPEPTPTASSASARQGQGSQGSVDYSESRALELIRQAEQDAYAIREAARRDAQKIVAAASAQLADLGVAYREAIKEARQVVDDLDNALRHRPYTENKSPDGGSSRRHPESQDT